MHVPYIEYIPTSIANAAMWSYEEEAGTKCNTTIVQDDLGRQRSTRACDLCRRKKSERFTEVSIGKLLIGGRSPQRPIVRCDGAQMPNHRCTNCIIYRRECLYVETAERRGPPKSYIDRLENRVKRLEKLLKEISPDALRQLDANPSSHMLSLEPMSSLIIEHPQNTEKSSKGKGIDTLKPDSSSENERDDTNFTAIMGQLTLGGPDGRVFGESSSQRIYYQALRMMQELTGENTTLDSDLPPHLPKTPINLAPKIPYSFPEPDLMHSLIDLYFRHVNLYFPILHRQIFEEALAKNLHVTCREFAILLLLVCANGSRYSDDPRVFLDGSSSNSCGWKWFCQAPVIRNKPLNAASLYDIQYYCLLCLFLAGTSAPQSCWIMVYIGIRSAQDIGLHRRSECKTADDELRKRAFWVLLCIDRFTSASLGRPCTMLDAEFDIDMPVECDDEYWDRSETEIRFNQPPSRPSLISYFTAHIKLMNILAFVLRTVYAVNPSKVIRGFSGRRWEEGIVAELDSALNQWADSLPDHLKWDPSREDVLFFNQSASLYCIYYYAQILVHMPFIPTPRKPSSNSFPSLAICINAARSSSHVGAAQHRRCPIPVPGVISSLFTSAIVLLLNIWSGKKSGVSIDPNKEMADVLKCMEVIKSWEGRWHVAGRLWDTLSELASAGQLPLPNRASNKRERDDAKEEGGDGSPDNSANHSLSVSGDSSASRVVRSSRPFVTPTPRTSAGSKFPNKSPYVPPPLHLHDSSMQTAGVHHSMEHAAPMFGVFPSDAREYMAPFHEMHAQSQVHPMHGHGLPFYTNESSQGVLYTEESYHFSPTDPHSLQTPLPPAIPLSSAHDVGAEHSALHSMSTRVVPLPASATPYAEHEFLHEYPALSMEAIAPPPLMIPSSGYGSSVSPDSQIAMEIPYHQTLAHYSHMPYMYPQPTPHPYPQTSLNAFSLIPTSTPTAPHADGAQLQQKARNAIWP